MRHLNETFHSMEQAEAETKAMQIAQEFTPEKGEESDQAESNLHETFRPGLHTLPPELFCRVLIRGSTCMEFGRSSPFGAGVQDTARSTPHL